MKLIQVQPGSIHANDEASLGLRLPKLMVE